MHTPTKRTSVERPSHVEAAIAERRLIQSLHRAVNATTVPEFSREAENTRRDINRRRVTPMKHIVTVLYNARLRGAPESEVRGFARELDAIITSWYPTEAVQWPKAHTVEEGVECEREMAEVNFAYDPSPTNAVKLIEAVERHESASVPLVTVARQYLERIERRVVA